METGFQSFINATTVTWVTKKVGSEKRSVGGEGLISGYFYIREHVHRFNDWLVVSPEWGVKPSPISLNGFFLMFGFVCTTDSPSIHFSYEHPSQVMWIVLEYVLSMKTPCTFCQGWRAIISRVGSRTSNKKQFNPLVTFSLCCLCIVEGETIFSCHTALITWLSESNQLKNSSTRMTGDEKLALTQYFTRKILLIRRLWQPFVAPSLTIAPKLTVRPFLVFLLSFFLRPPPPPASPLPKAWYSNVPRHHGQHGQRMVELRFFSYRWVKMKGHFFTRC